MKRPRVAERSFPPPGSRPRVPPGSPILPAHLPSSPPHRAPRLRGFLASIYHQVLGEVSWGTAAPKGRSLLQPVWGTRLPQGLSDHSCLPPLSSPPSPACGFQSVLWCSVSFSCAGSRGGGGRLKRKPNTGKQEGVGMLRASFSFAA